MRTPHLFLMLLLPGLLLAGCSAKRELSTAICFSKSQPEENKCLNKLAIELKDTVPCKKIINIAEANGTLIPPTQVSCFAEVAYWTGEIAPCDLLPSEAERSECKYRFELYIEAGRQDG